MGADIALPIILGAITLYLSNMFFANAADRDRPDSPDTILVDIDGTKETGLPVCYSFFFLFLLVFPPFFSFFFHLFCFNSS